MITFGVASSEEDLKSILALQRDNLPLVLSEREARENGFVTVEHDLPLLRRMNAPYPHIVARENEKVIGYALVMLRAFEAEISVLRPMFDRINQLDYQGKKLTAYRYFIMGQICIARANRGQGIFSGLYQEMKSRMKENFDCIITEISRRNQRSLQAHFHVGFENILEYHSDLGEDWVVTLLKLH